MKVKCKNPLALLLFYWKYGRKDWIEDVYNPGFESWSLLHCAIVWNPQPKILEFLLEYIEDSNVLDNDGRSPFFLAVQLKRFELCQILLPKVPNFDLNLPKYGSILSWSISPRDDLRFLKLLMPHVKNKNPYVICKQYFNEVTPLHIAVDNNLIQTVRYLISVLDENEIFIKNRESGETPCDIAKRKNFDEICELFKIL